MRRHLIIPDTQVKPGVPTEHIDWAAQAILEYKPDVIVHLGDHWDMLSMGSYSAPGSKEKEGSRIKDDVEFGNEAFIRLDKPMAAEIARLKAGKRKQWNPVRKYLRGNHDDRADRMVAADPRLEGIIGTDLLKVPDGWDVHPFLEIVEIDGVHYSHYFSNTHSGQPIGGSVDNRLNKIGRSFVQGHEQGFLYGVKQFPGSVTRHGLVAGSFYLHDESYRGLQSNGEWRGIVVLNEVQDGKYDIMPLSMDYLRRKFG